MVRMTLKEVKKEFLELKKGNIHKLVNDTDFIDSLTPDQRADLSELFNELDKDEINPDKLSNLRIFDKEGQK